MKLTIYRGTNEIGGSCVELKSGDERIVLDIGLPLEYFDANVDIKAFVPKIEGLFQNETKVSAIFISHAHPDHYGLLSLVNKDIPIYMSKASAIILKQVTPLLSENDYSDLNICELNDGDEVTIGNFIIKAHEVDHSAIAAMAFEINTDGKKILYSGDIRFHGRRSWRSQKLMDQINSLDYLILEGSTLGRENQEQLTEYEIESRFCELLKENKLTYAIFSTQNIDRFVSVYKACVRQNKILVLDPYSCSILENLREISPNLPQPNWNNIRVYFASNSITRQLAEDGTLYHYKGAKISLDEILKNPQNYVVKGNFNIAEKLLKRLNVEDVQIVYSLWAGYLDKADYCSEYKNKIIHLHTSGHACIKDLQEFASKINPKHIIPIHTEHKDRYADLFAANVLVLDDNQEVEL